MKCLRWQGIVAFFAVLVLLVGLFWWLSDWWVARTIERIGSDTIGAEVDVGDVDLHLAEGKLNVRDLQVTNAANPTLNILQIEHLKARLDLTQLAWKRVHIDEVDVEGIAFNQKRKTPGWVSAEKKTGITGLLPKIVNFDFSQLDNRDGAMAFVDSLQLSSLKSIEDLNTDVQQSREKAERAIKALPDKEKLKNYQDRFNALKAKTDGSGLNKGLAIFGKVKEADVVRKEINSDIQRVKDLRHQVQQDYAQFKQRYAEVKAAPSKDVDKLLSNFSFEAPGTDTLVSGALGPILDSHLREGMNLYQTAEPWISKARVIAGQDVNAPPPPARFAGVDVRFPENDPQPEFWLKKASLSGSLNLGAWSGAFSGTLTDVTDEPNLVKNPLKLNLKALGRGGGLITMDATMDTKSSVPVMTVAAKLEQLTLGALPLSTNPELSLAAQEAKLSGVLSGFSDAQKQDLNIALSFNHLTLEASTNQTQEIVQNIVAELAKADNFQLSLRYAKSADSQVRELHSSLDDMVKKAIRAALKKEVVKHTEKVKAKLLAQTESALVPLTESLQQYAGFDSQLSNLLESLENVLPKK